MDGLTPATGDGGQVRPSFKRFLPRTMFWRSLLIIVVPVLLAQVISTFIFFDRHWAAMNERLAFALSGEIAFLIDQVEDTTGRVDLQQTVSSAARTVNLSLALDAGRRHIEPDVVRPSGLFPDSVDTLRANLSRRLERPFTVKAFPDERAVEVMVETTKGVVQIVFPERRLFSATTYIFILWMLGSSLVLFSIAVLFMRNQVRPIRRLAVAAERFGRGIDLPSSFKPEGAVEVRQAGRAFLDMRDRIKRQIEQRTAMLAGVSHDLRTPLTRMKLQLEMMKETPDTAALRSDMAEMEKMIEGYLAFVRGEGDETPGAGDLSPILARIAANARRAGSAEVEENVAAGLIVRLRPRAIERAVGNIVANACKYGKKVWITAYRTGDQVEVSVDDNGPGVPPESYEDVFKPFFRMEKSRNPRTGGVGLGLSIAQDIVHSHGGEIWLEPSNRGGLRVVIRLPL